jgi:thiol-disulfide isomerase/thioredoxin
MARIRRKLRKDILLAVERETPEQMPSFTPAAFFSLPAGEKVIFDFASPESPVFGKPLVLSFFSTKCNHCLTELEALGRIRRELQTSMQPSADFNEPLFAAVNTNLPRIKKMKEQMPRYIEENDIEIPIYSNLPDRNSLIMRYGITDVPLILLFDNTGTPLARVRFSHMGHVKLKLHWILEEYLHVDF